ncbi:hypothetical protein [Vibrio phage phiKT1019]|nr:hypothetical protein [Vibrio phage phiKT1019]
MTKPTNHKDKLDLGVVTKSYTEDRDLKDPPSRLFRALLRKLESQGLNISQLVLLLQEYIKWEVTTEDPVKAKSERNTLMGNIRAAFFKNDTMTFPKLLTGLSILQVKKYTLTLKVEFEDGKTVEVSESGRVHNARNTK